MAIFFLRVQTIRRAAGRSAPAAAAYRAGVRILDQRTGETFDYRRRIGVVASGLVGWEGSRQDLWNAAEAAERRKDAVLGREVLVALPHGLPQDEHEELLQRLAGWLRQRHGVAVDWCLHAPDSEGDGRNWHGHLLLTARRVEVDNLGPKTLELDRRPASRHSIENIRQVWASLVNEALARHGQSGRVDNRSYIRQATTGASLDSPISPLEPIDSRRQRAGRLSRPRLEIAQRNLAYQLTQAHAELLSFVTDEAARREERQFCRR